MNSIKQFFALGIYKGKCIDGFELEAAAYYTRFEDATKKIDLTMEYAEIGIKNGIYIPSILFLIHLSTLEDKKIFEESFSRIITNPQLLSTFIVEVRSGDMREGLGRTIKTVVNNWLKDNLTEESTCKYKNKLKTIIKLTRPRSGGIENEFGKYLEYIQTGNPTFERIKQLKRVLGEMGRGEVTENSIASITEHRFQVDELKSQFGKLSDNDLSRIYTSVVPHVGDSELLMRINTFEQYVKDEERLIQRLIKTDMGNISTFVVIGAYLVANTSSIKRLLQRELMSRCETRVVRKPMIVHLDKSLQDAVLFGGKVSAKEFASLYVTLLLHQSGDAPIVASSGGETGLLSTYSEILQNGHRRIYRSITDSCKDEPITLYFGNTFDGVAATNNNEPNIVLVTASKNVSPASNEKQMMHLSEFTQQNWYRMEEIIEKGGM